MVVKKSLPPPSIDPKEKQARSSSPMKKVGKMKNNKGQSLSLDLTLSSSEALAMEVETGVRVPVDLRGATPTSMREVL